MFLFYLLSAIMAHQLNQLNPSIWPTQKSSSRQLERKNAFKFDFRFLIEGFSGSFLAVVSHSRDFDLSSATKPWIALEESLQAKGPDQAAASFSFWKPCQTCQLQSNFDMMLISSSFYIYWEHCIVRFTFETYWHDVRYHDIGRCWRVVSWPRTEWQLETSALSLPLHGIASMPASRLMQYSYFDGWLLDG